MAEVYKVWDEGRATHLALKLLREVLAEDVLLLRRFKREAQVLAKHQHPRTVRFYGLQQEEHLAFILIDSADGQSLKHEIFDFDGPMKLRRVLDVMRAVCGAFSYPHELGMGHCDMKSGNIMIHKNGTVLTAEFGVARVSEVATAPVLAHSIDLHHSGSWLLSV